MFRGDDPAGANALDARQVLGPDWQEAVNKNKWTCLVESALGSADRLGDLMAALSAIFAEGQRRGARARRGDS